MGALQRVEGDGVFDIRRVEVDDILYPALRHRIQDILGQVTVRVNQGQSVSISYVGDDHVFDQGGFPSTSLPNDVDMASPVLLLDPESLSDIPVIGYGKEGDRILIIVFALHS